MLSRKNPLTILRRYKKSAFFLLAGLVLYLYSAYTPNSVGYNCDKFTKSWGGGDFSFDDGSKYHVKICSVGNPGLFRNDHLDRLRLQVFGETGKLLAERFYTAHWLSPGFKDAKVESHQITFYDSADYEDVSVDVRIIKLPPTWWDGVRANYLKFDF